MNKTLTEMELRALIGRGLTFSAIARDLGCHPNYVSSACSVLGIKPTARNASRKPQLEMYVSDIRAGMTLTEIAKKHGKGAAAVFAALKRAGLPTSARALLRADAEQRKAA